MAIDIDLWCWGSQNIPFEDISPTDYKAAPLVTWGSGRIQAAAWASDGHQVVVADMRGVFLYTESLQLHQAIAAPPSIEQLIVNQNGTLFAATNRAVYLLHQDGLPGEPILSVCSNPVGITFAPYADLVAISTGATVQVYRLPGGEILAELPIVSVGTISSLAFSFDGRTLAAVTAAGIELWDLAAAQLIGLVGQGVAPITGVAFEASGRTLIMVVAGRIYRCKLENGLLIDVLADGLDDVQRVVTAASGAVAVVGGEQIYLWPTSISGKPLCLQGPVGTIQSLAFDHAGHTLLVASDAEIQLWDAQDGLLRERRRTHWGMVVDLAFAPDGQEVAAAGAGTLWRLKVGAEPWVTTLPHGRGLAAAVAFAPSGNIVVSASDTHLQAHGNADGRLWYKQHVGVLQSGGLGFSADGNRLVCVTADGIQILRAEDGALLDMTTRYSAQADDLVLSPDGTYLAVLIGDQVHLWDLQQGEQCWRLDLPTATCGIDLAIGGGNLAVAAADSVRVWRIADATQLLTL